MKIINVRAHVLEARLSQPFAYSGAWYSIRTGVNAMGPRESNCALI
jgi:D-galactarolactone cycloisomerase